MGRWGRRRSYAPSDQELEFGPEHHALVEEDLAELSEQRKAGRIIHDSLVKLGNVENIGAFYYEERVAELPNPGIFIAKENFGYLGIPVNANNAQMLAQLGTPSPYGDNKARRTKVDLAVRDTLELSPEEHFSLRNSAKWDSFIDKVIVSIRDKFALATALKVDAQLYKLLCYREGGHFETHKDTEKAPGMFATMSVVLPCAYTGGELTIQHDGKIVTLDAAARSAGVEGGSVFAWYTDLDHSVAKVTSGYRICLVYNLIAMPRKQPDTRAGSSTIPRAPTNLASASAAGKKLVSDLQRWAAGPHWKEWRFLWLLEHQYSDMGLGQGFGLKRRDKVVEAALIDAAEQATGTAAGRIRIERVAVQVVGSYGCDGDEPMFEDDSATGYATSKILGRIEFGPDTILQPCTMAKLGKLVGGGWTGNYAGEFEQDYKGHALLLYVPKKLVAGCGGAAGVELGDIIANLETAQATIDPLEVLEATETILAPLGLRGASTAVHHQSSGKELTRPAAQKLAKRLCDALIGMDAKRESVHAKPAAIDCWGNTALVATDGNKSDPIYDLILIASTDFPTVLSGVLRPVFEHVLQDTKAAIAKLSEKAFEFADYSQHMDRVTHPDLITFLAERATGELRLRLNKASRLMIHRQLEGIDVDHETAERSGDMGTMVIRKRESMARIADAKSKTLRGQLQELERLRMTFVDAVSRATGSGPAAKTKANAKPKAGPKAAGAKRQKRA